MANQKISELTTITDIDNTDLLAIVDISATQTKKATVSQIKALSPVQSVNGDVGDVTVQETLISGTNIKTINSESILGSGDISISGGEASWGDINGTLSDQADLQTALNGKEDLTNKSTSVTSDQASNTKYPSVKAVYDWAVGLFATITNLALKTDKLILTNRQTASYTLVLGDADKLVEMNVSTANNLTIPLNSSVAFPTGTQILLSQYGAGQTTIVATSGVTVRSSGAKLKLTGQYSGATLIKIGTDEWYLFGDIAS
jgi:hypothetical protein